MISLSFLTTFAPNPYAIPAIANNKAITTTIEFINGEFKIPWTPASVPRKYPLAGATKPTNPNTVNNVAIPAKRNPRCSDLDIVISFSSTCASPVYFPKRGSTIFSVTIVPIIVIKIVEAIKNHQFAWIPTT